MTVTVVFHMSTSFTPESLAEMEAWLQPYIDAGSTTTFPAPSSGNVAYREWDTLENAELFIEKVKTLPNVFSAEIAA